MLFNYITFFSNVGVGRFTQERLKRKSLTIIMKKSDFYVVAVIYAIGFWFLAMTLDLPEEAQTYPLVLICSLLTLNSLYFIQVCLKYRKKRTVRDDLPEIFHGFQVKQFVTVIIGAVIYLALMPVLGFYIDTALYLIGAMLLLNVKRLYIGIALVVMFAMVYGVFTLFLKVPLPVGMIFG